MLEKREILLRLKNGHHIRQISRDLGIHRPIIRSLYNVAVKNNWLDPNIEMPTDYEIAQAIIAKENQKSRHALDVHVEEIKRWHMEGVTAVVIQRLLKQKYSHSCGISSLRRYIVKKFPKIPDPVMIRSTKPGEVMDVDFGFLGQLWDELLNKLRKVWVFSARLRHSRKTYRELVWRQDVSTFLRCHIHAFEHFNGVTAQVVLDNLKAGVIKSCIDNDMLNRSYKELAEYYGFMISPCLPRMPQHKGGVENDMNYIKRNFWPEIREKMKISPHINLKDAQEELEKWDRDVANVRKIHGINRSPDEIFKGEEAMALRPLPASRWEPTEWFQCVVGRDWRISHDGSHYSVPYFLINQTVQIRVTSQFVKVFLEYQEVASHPKAIEKRTYQKNPHHAPPFKEAVLSCNRQGLLLQAEEVGEYVYKFCEKMLSNPSIDKLRPVRCLLKLAFNYEKERLDRACKRALAYNTIRYQSVKNILDQGLDEELLEIQAVQTSQTSFKFARNPLEYQCIEQENISIVNQ